MKSPKISEDKGETQWNLNLSFKLRKVLIKIQKIFHKNIFKNIKLNKLKLSSRKLLKNKVYRIYQIKKISLKNSILNIY